MRKRTKLALGAGGLGVMVAGISLLSGSPDKQDAGKAAPEQAVGNDTESQIAAEINGIRQYALPNWTELKDNDGNGTGVMVQGCVEAPLGNSKFPADSASGQMEVMASDGDSFRMNGIIPSKGAVYSGVRGNNDGNALSCTVDWKKTDGTNSSPQADTYAAGLKDEPSSAPPPVAKQKPDVFRMYQVKDAFAYVTNADLKKVATLTRGSCVSAKSFDNSTMLATVKFDNGGPQFTTKGDGIDGTFYMVNKSALQPAPSTMKRCFASGDYAGKPKAGGLNLNLGQP
ncbi:MAG: hypothetical protein DI551_04250 [Micavibrio aeruginosavorus]|uniref:Uncharacterized protein n=1 Tax=Micavibrio aeruginosavorus TaxID=349221 RepID=A0A2W5PQF3_9BACT|nr:MAG: hypothetical protein DI551_04250 [Micavibrio aeruginosavorus]